MKKLPLILLLAAALAFTACESRMPPAEPGEETFDWELERETPSQPEEDVPQEPEEDTEPEGIDDEEQVAYAKEVVGTLLDRAAVCDRIYRGRLEYNNALEPVAVEDAGSYVPVSDERFYTMDDIQTSWENTFGTSAKASAKLDAVREARVFMSINGELYQTAQHDWPPLTMGGWDFDSMKLLEYGEDRMVVWMRTTLAGQDNGGQRLTASMENGTWLLGDDYFLD